MHAGDRPATEYTHSQSHAVMIGNVRWIGNSRVGRLGKSLMQAQNRGELMRLSRLVRAPYLLQGNDIWINRAQCLDQYGLPFLPLRPESPPDVPGHDPCPSTP